MRRSRHQHRAGRARDVTESLRGADFYRPSHETIHDAIIGPYHRNGQQIADVMNAFRGTADEAHVLIAKYHSDYLLTCPKSSTTTIFMSEAPKGFYSQLQRGQVPSWLTPIPLPEKSPFKIWKVAL